MITEEGFQAALDLHPEDQVTRGALADWLEEQGDPRAQGYRALWLLKKYPQVFFQAPNVRSRFYRPDNWQGLSDCIPADWFALADPDGKSGGENVSPVWNRSRREVEDNAALAFAKLPAERRLELFGAVTV